MKLSPMPTNQIMPRDIKLLYSLLILPLLCICNTGSLSAVDRNTNGSQAAKPNVILILADDMGMGDLASRNGNRNRTPHLDQLKQQSVWFEHAYSAAPVCAPARASLFTGRYPHRTGVVTLNQQRYPQLTRLRKDETTLANLFQDHGYVTGLIGKWHCGDGAEYQPLARGFDEFEGFVDHTHVPSYFDYKLLIQDKLHAESKQYLTNDLSNRAVAFVRRHQQHPFFLHLAHYAPHRPLGAPEDRIEPYLKKGFDRETATVYAMIEIMDEGIGNLLGELDRLKLRENTIVIFASDNGPDPLVSSRFNAQLRGTKYTVYEGGIRVPMMIRWPAQLDPSERDEVVHFVDVLPTLMELCQLEIPDHLKLDGRSFAGILRRQPGTETLPQSRFWQWNRKDPLYSHNAAMREGDWKLVRPYVTRGIPKADSTMPPALYQLSSDPTESNDVSAQYPARTARMNEALQAWSQEVERDRIRLP
ncbi:arylsulfatase [Novipirellula caenicola]|uniref:N-acetylgalactosamine-6-O-sulfatase n=1 Tax=Novipirellula caenicola TaxID=1536901 RepID=A0ABP9VQP0_9BACT